MRLWNPATGQPIGDPLIGHTGAVNDVAFSPDGQRLATGSDDGTVRLWPADASPEMLCDKLTANMSLDQWRDWVSPGQRLHHALREPAHPGRWLKSKDPESIALLVIESPFPAGQCLPHSRQPALSLASAQIPTHWQTDCCVRGVS